MTVLAVPLVPLAGAAEEVDEVVAVEPGGTLYVDLERGSIEVDSHDAHEVRIQARARGWAAWTFAFDLARDGNDVRLTGESIAWGVWPFGGARVSVRAWVPREYSVDVRTRGGRIRIGAVSGRVVAETSGGQVELQGAEGLVSLRSSGGAIRARDVKGHVRADTSGGAIQIANVQGDVQVSTSGGAIEVAKVGGSVSARTSGGAIEVRDAAEQVDATTSGGPIRATFSGEPAGRLETSGGSIEVRIPAGAGALLDAETRGGQVEVAPAIPIRGEIEKHRVVAEINGGGASLLLRTSGGSIRVGVR